MNSKIELPLVEPIYRTYNFDAAGTVIAKENPTIKNWYLNEVMILNCNRKFLSGFTSPLIYVSDSAYHGNPYITNVKFYIKYLGSGIHSVIRNLIDDGYYVFFWGIDDYYFKGKSWYHEKHFYHDGMITGYDIEKKTYSIYAYDENWIQRKFETPQRAFTKAVNSSLSANINCYLDGIKVKKDNVKLDPGMICEKLKEYLDSSIEKYPIEKEGLVFGAVVHKFIAMYLDKLYSGEIPYKRMDRRVFRMIWEHKKVMLERIKAVEEMLPIGNNFSRQYEDIVKQAENMRMIYASYNHKRRDSLLIYIKEKLLQIYEKEKVLLTDFITATENAIKK